MTEKKLVVITGASSGIGKALYNKYKELLEYDVLGLSRRGPDLFVDLKDLRKFSMSHSVDILINCAGIMPLENETEEVMQVNFWGAYYLTKKLLCKDMCIINIASVSATHPDPHQPIYAASKAALIAMSKSLAKQWASFGVRVNCISPGFYDTNLVVGETPQNLIDTIPMMYEEDPLNLFPVVRMIERTKYMTGANIVVDGGLTA